jgi:hypothetical protein
LTRKAGTALSSRATRLNERRETIVSDEMKNGIPLNEIPPEVLMEMLGKQPKGGGADALEWASETASMEDVREILRIDVSSTEGRQLAAKILGIVADRLDSDVEAIGGDHADYHNVAMAASGISAYDRGIRVLKAGLYRYPDNPTLVGDMIQAMLGVGKVLEAIEKGITYWSSTPLEVLGTDWRVATFTRRCVEQIDPSFSSPVSESIAKLIGEEDADWRESPPVWGEVIERMHQDVVQSNPEHIKIWHGLSMVQTAQGKTEEAIDTLRRGLGQNRFSQQLAFSLGDRLVSLAGACEEGDGRSAAYLDEAVQCLVRALKADHQEQFQPDVPAGAVMATLAQAYEAQAVTTGNRYSSIVAGEIYHQIFSEPSNDSTLKQYAETRIRCLRTLDQISVGEQAVPGDVGDVPEQSRATASAEPLPEMQLEAHHALYRVVLVLSVPWIVACVVAAGVIAPGGSKGIGWILSGIGPIGGMLMGRYLYGRGAKPKHAIVAGAVTAIFLLVFGISITLFHELGPFLG